MTKGGAIDTIYMDFMKAFDKVPHKRLITKLESYGLPNQIIKWVDNFLNERNQKVTVNRRLRGDMIEVYKIIILEFTIIK